MTNIFKKNSGFFIFPTLLLAVAASPFSCNLSKDGGVFKSKNGGAGWEQKIKTPAKATIASVNALSLAIDPRDPNIIYLGTDGDGIYKSTDETETWSQVVDQSDILYKRAVVADIKISPENSDNIYAAVFQNNFGRILRSRNSGSSWQEIYVASKEKVSVLKIEIDKGNSNILYAGTSDGGVIKSSDSGSSWQQVNWFGDAILDIKIDPKSSQVIYVVTQAKGIQRSSDGGQTWQDVAVQKKTEIFAPKSEVSEIAIDYRNSDIIYAVSRSGLLVSNDRGQNWQNLNTLVAPDSSIDSVFAQDDKNPNTIYYGFGSVIYKTTNYGTSWSVQQLSTSRQISAIKIDPMDSNIIYVGVHK